MDFLLNVQYNIIVFSCRHVFTFMHPALEHNFLSELFILKKYWSIKIVYTSHVRKNRDGLKVSQF